MSKNYFWGAPASYYEREDAVRDVQKKLSGKCIEKRYEMLQGFMNRVTDKTTGLLATAGIVLAISLFVMDREATWPSVVSSLMAICAILLLSLNLGTVWRKDHANWSPDDDFFGETLVVFSRRVVRLQLALWLVVISSVLSAYTLLRAVA